MKKYICLFLALCLMLTMFTCQSFATDITAAGFYSIGSDTDVTVKPKTSTNGSITSTSAEVDSTKDGYEIFYPNSEKLEVSVDETENGKQYLVLLVTGDVLPTSDSQICYIDQVQATGTSVNFSVYPLLPQSTTKMSLFVTSDQSEFTTKQVSLNYAASGTYTVAPYTLGDVDGDGKFTATDALCALQMSVGIDPQGRTWTDNEEKAANVDKDEYITASDALYILQRSVGIANDYL